MRIKIYIEIGKYFLVNNCFETKYYKNTKEWWYFVRKKKNDWKSEEFKWINWAFKKKMLPTNKQQCRKQFNLTSVKQQKLL